MNDAKRKRAELRQKLIEAGLPLRADGIINVDEISIPINEKVEVERICEKCKSSVSSILTGGEIAFVRCSKCGYPVWFSNWKRVPDMLDRLPWYYLEGLNGNIVKDYKGDIRLFESEDAARKYLNCCELDPEHYAIKYYGKK